MNNSNVYDSNFFMRVRSYSYTDGKIILPNIMKWYAPKSVADFGCAEGTWLSIIKDLDNNIDVTGFDGNYIDRNKLEIDSKEFISVDLDEIREVGRKFDLVISTEVAEHLKPESADQFVELLTSASDNILFSAAIPGQGGDNHLNEQWQNYWTGKFESKGFIPDYSVREFFWNDDRITNWRRQNIMFYTRNSYMVGRAIQKSNQLNNVVHPSFFKDVYELGRENEELIDYIVSAPETYTKIDQVVKKAIQENRNIAITPFGKNGKICKKILNLRYGIKEKAILDNMKNRIGPFVIPLNKAAELPNDTVIIDTCSNEQVHDEVLEEIEKYVNKERIITIFPIG